MKKLALISFVFILLGFLSVSTAQTKLLTGKYSASTGTAGYTLDKNTGERTYTIEVNFLNPFESRPEVMVFVSTLDADKDVNLRYSVEATSISRDGFTVKISTWADTKIYVIGGTWVAYAE